DGAGQSGHVGGRGDQGGVLDAAAAEVVGVHDGEVALATGEVVAVLRVVEAPDLTGLGVVLDQPALGHGGAVEGLGDALDVEPVARRDAGVGVDGHGDVSGAVTRCDLHGGRGVAGVLHLDGQRVAGADRQVQAVLPRLRVGVGGDRG